MEDINLVVSIAQNVDVSETIYFDYLNEYVYQTLYKWKWYFIYFTGINTIVVCWAALKLIESELVKPIHEITDYIEQAQKEKKKGSQVAKMKRRIRRRKRLRMYETGLNFYLETNYFLFKDGIDIRKTRKVDEVDELRKFFFEFFIQSHD